ncbi:hypothetical protein NP233_g4001 [Leucocoprinus birnbaumii]|uniref:DNA 3'-5' helicase n=1 Tax=Leucocoprinus birnbaumii TaxID=56174 RepID=A0AAD5VVI0_9AGAR|nr:hypothetical protein NP233_g4001 [Leucocoprinus birnbaumii]
MGGQVNLDEYDYLCNVGDELLESSHSRPSAQLSEDVFDEYMNELLTSSPSPPQRSGNLRSPSHAQSHQYAHFRSTVDIHSSNEGPSTPISSEQMLNGQPNLGNITGNLSAFDRARNGRNLHIKHTQPGISDFSDSGHSPDTIPTNKSRLVSDLPDIFRGIFKFPTFNAMQSHCFDHITSSTQDLVVSAPTGSGKTVLFELAIITLLTQAKSAQSKVVYMAPTKALCSERSRDWVSKFGPLGFKTCELTGDTAQFGRGAWGDAKKSTIVVTTVNFLLFERTYRILTLTKAEKWDSLTRNWQDSSTVLSQIRLFLVDEVHTLNETRGSTLEVVISRMKARNDSMRFILVSATVPNIHDIANWISSTRDGKAPCYVLQFGEEYRPCKLTRYVIGVPRSSKQNEFQYAAVLDAHIFPVLQQHSVMKPILIFCSTRKGTITTATILLKAYEEAEKRKERLPWARASRINACKVPFLPTLHDLASILPEVDLATNGIGVHHAGLGIGDRRLVEDLFLEGTLRVLIATSTLSVGVNLPAHTVVIRGVKLFQNNANVEYSDLDIIQMIGRAGRPQFGKPDGVAIIMCEPQLVGKYETLTQGKTILESSLHHNMLEHLNSEIALGTISNSQDAKTWLRGTFLYQRLQKNPDYYAIQQETGEVCKEKLDQIILQNIRLLESSELVRCNVLGSADTLESTEFGDIMSKFYVRQPTMASILSLPEKLSLREILETIAAAEEFATLRLRASEKPVYNILRTHNDIRFSITKVEKVQDKVFLLLQAVLGNISLSAPEMRQGDAQPQLDSLTVFKHAPKLAKVVVEVAIAKKNGVHLLHGLEVARCLTAKAWEDRPTILRQIEQIGEKSLKVLAEHGITTLDQLRQQLPARIEILLNRKAPFGHEVLASAAEIPQFALDASRVSVKSDGGKTPVQLEVSIQCSLKNQASAAKPKKKSRYHDMTTILTITSDLDLIDFRRTATKSLKETRTFNVIAKLAKPRGFVGNLVKQIIKPSIPPTEYPTLNTRPISSMALDLEEFENDPQFWEMDFSEASDPAQAAATKIQDKKQQSAGSVENCATQLRNGKYECSHTCADKSKCLHLCCREGKSQPAKQRGENNKGKQKVRPRPNDSNEEVIGMQSPFQRHMSSLERLHKQADVRNNLKMQQARLKPENPGSTSRKRKIKPIFDIQFTEVELRPSASRIAMDEPFEEDLPSVEELLLGKGGQKITDPIITPPTCSPEYIGVEFQAPSPKSEPPRKTPPLQPMQPLFILSGPDPHVSSQTLTSSVLKEAEVMSGGSPGQIAVSPAQVTELSVVDFVINPPVNTNDSGPAHIAHQEEFADLDEWLNSGFVETN